VHGVLWGGIEGGFVVLSLVFVIQLRMSNQFFSGLALLLKFSVVCLPEIACTFTLQLLLTLNEAVLAFLVPIISALINFLLEGSQVEAIPFVLLMSFHLV